MAQAASSQVCLLDYNVDHVLIPVFLEPEITLVLSPVTVTPRRDERSNYVTSELPLVRLLATGSHISLATVPTLGDALASLDDLCNDLTSTLKQISDIGAELAKKDQISIDGTQNVRTLSLISAFDRVLCVLRSFASSILCLSAIWKSIKRGFCSHKNLSAFKRTQRTTLATFSVSVDHVLRTCAHNPKSYQLDSLEMMLLLLWRHLEYYATPQHMQIPPTKTTIANAMRLLATSEPAAFKGEITQRMAPTLAKLSVLLSVRPIIALTFVSPCAELTQRNMNPSTESGRTAEVILRSCYVACVILSAFTMR